MKVNKNNRIPLIENILILGLKSDELNKLQSLNINKIEEVSSKYKAVILDNYQSIHISRSFNDNFYKKICEYSFPGGIVNSSENMNINRKQKITFCIKYKDENKDQMKHITCAYIQSGLKIHDKNIISINTGIALVSSLDIYECHKEILSHFIDVIMNYFVNNSTITSNQKNREVYLTNILPHKIFEEYRLLRFYFSFFLNLTLDNYKSKNNICLTNITNNYFQNIFCKIILNSKKRNSILLLKEYDTSIILEKFYIEDLIKLYCALLLDKSIILLFNDYYEINIIINSLLSITYPLNNSKKYKIEYIYNKSDIQGQKLTTNNQLNNIIGIYFTDDDDLSFLPEEGKTPSFISTNNTNLNENTENNINDNMQYIPCFNFYYSKNDFVYSIKDKKFLNCPFENENYNEDLLPEEIINDIKSQLYFSLGEKLTINSEMNFDETDLGLIFDNSTCKKINTFLYLNLKIKAIFFRAFLMLMNGLNSYLNFNYNFNSEKNRGIYNINNYFENINEFIKGCRLKQNLINNKNFQDFLVKYIKKYKSKDKYMFIYKTLNEIKNKSYSEINNYLENIFKEQIRNGIINYYNFDYINLDKYFIDYITYQESNNVKDYLLDPSINFTLYQLINVKKENIDINDLYCKDHSYTNYLETELSFLNKFQIYKIFNSVNVPPKKKINKLIQFKPIAYKIANPSNQFRSSYENTYDIKQTKDKMKAKKDIPNFDYIFGQIFNDEEFLNLKQGPNNVQPKRELCSESKKFKFKKIKKEPSPFHKLSMGPKVGRNSSYYNNINNPLNKNNNFKDKKKIFQLSNGNEFRKSTQSFREKKTLVKSKNKIIKNNLRSFLAESDVQVNSFKERSGKRKYTYNQEESINALKQITMNNSNIRNKHIINNINNSNDILRGPITSTKKYENNYGHLPKLAGDLDDEILSDEDSSNK